MVSISRLVKAASDHPMASAALVRLREWPLSARPRRPRRHRRMTARYPSEPFALDREIDRSRPEADLRLIENRVRRRATTEFAKGKTCP